MLCINISVYENYLNDYDYILNIDKYNNITLSEELKSCLQIFNINITHLFLIDNNNFFRYFSTQLKFIQKIQQNLILTKILLVNFVGVLRRKLKL